MRKIIVLAGLFWVMAQACVVMAQTPSLSGTWLGRLKQTGAEPFSDYRLRLDIKQEGVKVVGMSYINVSNNPDYYAKMRLEGRFEKGVFTYHELELVDSRHGNGWGWCLKRAELNLKQAGEYLRLEGPWEGYMDDFVCSPGTLTLEKLNPQPKPTVVEKPNPVVVEKPVEAKGVFGEVNGRKITHRKEITVTTDQLTLYIWDGDKVDGDIISLQYNGVWLLRKHGITKVKEPIKILVVPGEENQLILYAENQGQYPPNTAAVTFFDGKQERNLSLSSDGTTCGALKFVVAK
jgi:hypothetical protein